MTGCRVGWSAGTPKSCAFVPGSALWKPSLMACVLEFSWGARDWCGTCSSPVPEPEDVAWASLLRAERVFDFSLSIATTRLKTRNAVPRAIPDKHGFMTWKRPWPNAGWRLKIGFTSLEFVLVHVILRRNRNRCQPLSCQSTRIARASTLGGNNPLGRQFSVWTTHGNERL
jgi:hypothetical protein